MARRQRKNGNNDKLRREAEKFFGERHTGDEVTERDVNDAVGVIRRDYYNEVEQWAEEYKERIENGEFEDREAFIEQMDQEVDGAQRVILTWHARLGLLVSDNEDLGFEEGVVELSGDDIPYSQLMYFAFRQDIIEQMGRIDVDVDDDEAFEKAGAVARIKRLDKAALLEVLESVSTENQMTGFGKDSVTDLREEVTAQLDDGGIETSDIP
jgi:hypothetical protein